MIGRRELSTEDCPPRKPDHGKWRSSIMGLCIIRKYQNISKPISDYYPWIDSDNVTQTFL